MQKEIVLTICPVCGGDIERRIEDWHSSFDGKPYTVPALTFYVCLDCGEQVFSQQAVKKIRTYSPAYELEVLA